MRTERADRPDEAEGPFSAAGGKRLTTVQAAQKGPGARRRPRAAREAYSPYVERAAEGANETDGPFSAACDLVFVYGTLMRGFPLHRLIEGRAEYVGCGTTKARLLDLGSYPAAVPDLHATVVGELYRLRERGLWRVLDSAEGPQYHREGVTIRMADGREVAAFIYLYVGPPDRGVRIPGGDYRAHALARSIHRSR